MTDIEHFSKLMKEIKFAMLTTSSADGSLTSRPMTLQETEFNGDLWFFADRTSRLAKDILDRPKVNLAFADVKSSAYVSACGEASLVDDETKAKELWNPFYKAWFPQGLQDPKMCLIKVSVETADYWESPGSPIVHLVGFAKAILTGEKASTDSLGKHGHMQIN